MSAFTSVSLMSGSGTVWVGVAIAAVSVALAFFLGATNGVRVTASICLALGLASALYIEHQLDQKRTEMSNIFKNGP